MVISNYHTKVISFERRVWRFFDYVEGDTNPIERWYENDLSEEGQQLFTAMLKNCRKIEDHSQWTPFRGYLQGKLKEYRIWELGFVADKRQHRVLGVFAGEKTAVLLIGCYHKGKVYTPAASLDTACKRAKALHQKKGGTHEREIDLCL